jgi:hypothetical protein
MTPEELRKADIRPELSQIINDLINDKLKVQLIDAYSGHNLIPEKNLAMKRIFEEVENKINEMAKEEKKLDFEMDELSKHLS